MTEQEIKKQIAHAKAVVSTWPVWKQNILVDSTVSSRQTARTPVIKTSAQVVSKLTEEPDAPHYAPESKNAGCWGCLIILGMMFVFFLVVARNIMEGIAPGSTSWPW